MTAKPQRPALRYHGGKWQLAKWIIHHFPNHTCYCEPFGGGASVLLSKTPAYVEVYNDLNGEVVNFFRVLRESPAELFAAIDLTPYSRQEYLEAQEQDLSLDKIERARRLYTWAWQGRGRAGIVEPGGWRFMSRDSRGCTPVDDWNNNQHLWAIAKRLKQVQIENDDAATVIKRFDSPETLFYVDPPYVQSTRGKRWSLTGYAYELTDQQHEELADLLHSVSGMVILSGYPSELYDRLYTDWTHIDKTVKKDNGAGEATERLWISPKTIKQETLFDLEVQP
jgi:DNA adenine methylase